MRFSLPSGGEANAIIAQCRRFAAYCLVVDILVFLPYMIRIMCLFGKIDNYDFTALS